MLHLTILDPANSLDWISLTLDHLQNGPHDCRWLRGTNAALLAADWNQGDALLVAEEGWHSPALDSLRRAAAQQQSAPILLIAQGRDQGQNSGSLDPGVADILYRDDLTPLLLEKAVRYAVRTRLYEDHLRAGEERFHSLFDEMTEGFALHEMILDDTGRPVDYIFLEINPAFERLTGLNRAKTVGQRVSQLLPDEYGKWVELYSPVVLAGQAVHSENFSTGLNRYYDIYAYSPAPGQFAVLFLDINERIKMEEELRVNLEKYRTLFDSFPLGITVTDEKGQIIESNREAERLLGLDREEHLQRSIDSEAWQIIRTDGQVLPAEEYASVRALKENRRIDNMEMGIVKKQEDVTWINVTAAPFPGSRGGVIVTYHDITERRQLEDNLRTSEERFRVAFENSNISIFTLDRERRINWTYDLGYNPVADVIGKYYFDVMPPVDLEESLRVVDAVIQNGETRHIEARFTVGGQIQTFLINLEPTRDRDGKINGLLGAAIDISDMRRLETQNAEHRAQIEVQRRLIRQREMERLQVARSLHDGPFQTLNAAAIGLLEAVREEKDPETRQRLEWVQATFRQQIFELRQFIQELRPPALVAFGLETTIRSSLENFHRQYPGIDLQTEMMRDGKILPEETRLALYRIFQEVMTNIGKHAQADKIIISLQVTGEEVILQVDDDGTGFNVPRDWSEMAMSNHLGLISIHERAEMIHAKLEILSEAGRGTRVRVAVPLDGKLSMPV